MAANAIVGFIRLLENPIRHAGSAYYEVDRLPLVNIHDFGIGFIVVALLLVLISSNRKGAFRGIVILGIGLWTFWAALFFAAAVHSGSVSFAPAALYIVIAILHATLLIRPRPC